MASVRRGMGLGVIGVTSIVLALSACGGDGGDDADSNFSGGSGSSGAPPASDFDIPPSQRTPPLLPGSPRLPLGSGSASPGIVNRDGTFIPPYIAALNGDQSAAAFVAPLTVLDLNTRVLTIAGQRIRYDSNTVFAGRAIELLRTGNLVEVDATPIDAATWLATRVAYVADTVTPAAALLTLSGRAEDIAPNAVQLGTWRIDLGNATTPSSITAGMWLTVHGYDDGDGLFHASAATAFGMNGVRANTEVIVRGPAFLDNGTLHVAGIPILWARDVDLTALQLETLAPGDWISVAGVVDASATFVYGTDARR